MSQLGLGMVHDDEVDGGGRRPGRRGGPAVILALVVVGALIFAAGFFSIRWLTSGGDYAGDGTGTVVVEVPKGASLRAIGQAMADAGVVASADAFTSAAAAEPKSSSIAPGSYVMKVGMSGSAAVAWMLDPASRDVAKVVVPEGMRLDDVVAAVSKATGLGTDDLEDSLSRADELGLPSDAQGSPEGYLFPATYEFSRDVTADEVIRTMIERSNQSAAELGLAEQAKTLGMTPHEILTVASLVQGEVAPSDYPKAARVIYNRLATHMPLQLDSTVNYGLGTSDVHLSADQLASDTPYNTYVHQGLPPTPIGAPGEAAVEAALTPAKGDWIYFITVDLKAGKTKFTSSYEQFTKWKRQLQGSG